MCKKMPSNVNNFFNEKLICSDIMKLQISNLTIKFQNLFNFDIFPCMCCQNAIFREKNV